MLLKLASRPVTPQQTTDEGMEMFKSHLHEVDRIFRFGSGTAHDSFHPSNRVWNLGNERLVKSPHPRPLASSHRRPKVCCLKVEQSIKWGPSPLKRKPERLNGLYCLQRRQTVLEPLEAPSSLSPRREGLRLLNHKKTANPFCVFILSFAQIESASSREQ